MNNKIIFEIPFGYGKNSNGRIYSRETVQEIMEQLNEKPFSIDNTLTENIEIVNVKGFTESAKYHETDNRLEVTARVNDDVTMFLKSGFKVVPCGIGDIDADTRIIKEYKLIKFIITNNSAFDYATDIMGDENE